MVIWKGEDGIELAASLETTEGCDQLWAIICGFFEGTLDLCDLELLYDDDDPSDEQQRQQQELLQRRQMQIQQQRLQEEQQMRSLHLPETISFDNLSEVEGILQVAIRHVTGKRTIAAQVLDLGLIPQILDLFRIAEDLHNLPILHQLYQVLRGIVLLNTPTVLSELFEEHHIMHVVGIFECKCARYGLVIN